MAYGLYLSLDQTRWFRSDFSSENKLTGTVYTDINQQTAKDLTGYTVNLRLSRPRTLGARLEKTADIVVAANGTWSYAVGEGEMPPRGIYWTTIDLTKSGVSESTLNRVELHVLEGPSG